MYTILKKIRSNNKKKIFSFLSIISLFAFGILVMPTFSISAQETTAEQYAPILYFEAEEQLYPIDAQFHIDNSDLYALYNDTAILVNERPTIENISQITGEFFYLDNIHGKLKESESIISEYQQQKNIYDSVVYYRETTQNTKTILQYWFFYAYNDGDLNVHEGDWEMIQIAFESNTPSDVMYSQHHSGQQTGWENVDKTNTHPHVYVARGSHANYLRSFSGKLGVASDTVGNNGIILNRNDYSLVELTDQGWLSFEGRWGEVGSIQETALGFSGPPGPQFRENGQMWNSPILWGEQLPILNTALLPVEFLLYHFLTIFVILTIISICLLSYGLYRRKQNHGLGPRKFSFLYIDGMNQYSIGNLLFFAGVIIGLIGLTLPWYEISGSINGGGYATEGVIDFFLVDGLQGVQITFPGSNGPIAVGSLILPFSLLIGIGFVFTIFKSIGIKESNFLGRAYLWRGIALIIPFIILVIIIFSLVSFLPSAVPGETVDTQINTFFSALSQNPFGGSTSVPISDSDVSGSIDLSWGIQMGAYLLLSAGVVLLIAAALLITSRKTFF